ncbi:hypothetical protein [Caenimonas soli]|uniref:hypothetical protein n=1 Tax=Caenimonas soli TaxID=2735555 RepID=UPI001F28FD05|nr:hypothetical protein [Caenimonas soli]
MTRPKEEPTTSTRSEFFEALQKGLLLGALALLLILPPLARGPQSPQSPGHAVMRANFGAHQPSPEARSVADWVVDSRDHKKMSFVIVDKKDAKVYVFSPSGQLKEASVALLGSAHGDNSVPGIGDKPLSQVLPEEKTTPAGRFIAELGMNTKGEDIVWVDYDAAVSMHRVRANVKSEQRLERLASPTPDDNRISFGCINLPPQFYENTLKPAVQAGGAVIYVLPETRSPAETFAAYYDVDARLKLAQR